MRVTKRMTVDLTWYEDGCVEATITGPEYPILPAVLLQLGLESTPVSALHQLGRQLQLWQEDYDSEPLVAWMAAAAATAWSEGSSELDAELEVGPVEEDPFP